MIKIPKEKIIEKIIQATGLLAAEIDKRIQSKLQELSGLISEEGAAHIIANELGVKLLETSGKQQIKDIYAGLRGVEVVGKVTRVFEVRNFESQRGPGKVGSFMMADETGSMRITAWGNRADTVPALKEGDIVRIKSGYARENNGKVELHLNDASSIAINPEGETIGEVKATRQSAQRKKISEITPEDSNVEILGTVVSSFDPRFFEVCPTCGKRARPADNGVSCVLHGVVKPDYSYVMNAVLDDGSENIRTIFFKNQLQHLINKTHDEILDMKNGSFEDVKNDLLGKIIKVIGRASKNDMFSRLELVAQIVDPNPSADEELRRLETEFGKEKEKPKEQEKTEIDEPKSQKEAPPSKHHDYDAEEDIINLEDIEEADDNIYE